MFSDIRKIQSLTDYPNGTNAKSESGSFYNEITPTISKFWAGPLMYSTYINSQTEAWSCVGGDVACNAAPAVPSPADAWSGSINNP